MTDWLLRLLEPVCRCAPVEVPNRSRQTLWQSSAGMRVPRCIPTSVSRGTERVLLQPSRAALADLSSRDEHLIEQLQGAGPICQRPIPLAVPLHWCAAVQCRLQHYIPWPSLAA